MTVAGQRIFQARILDWVAISFSRNTAVTSRKILNYLTNSIFNRCLYNEGDFPMTEYPCMSFPHRHILTGAPLGR